MGAGASVHEALPSVAEVHSAHARDRYCRARQRDEEFLARENQLCGVHGFDSTAGHTQPLMKDKLERSLACLDDLGASYSDDQRRSRGHTEAPAVALTAGGAVRQFCLLGGSTLACASDDGPIWVYNWREGSVVSTLRERSLGGGGASHLDGPASRLCPATSDHSLLASGDERGFVALWDLRGPQLELAVRLHESCVTGLQGDWERQRLVSTSRDTYIILYDTQQRQVVERGLPASCSCGSGVPNTVLALGGEQQRHLILVGGADGKLRVWSRDQGPLRREHTLSCGAAHPTQCRLAGDGWQALVSTAPADPAHCAGRSDQGGLLLFDLRRLGGDGSRAELARRDGLGAPAAEHVDVEASGMPAPRGGVLDMALVEEGGESLAFCLTDGPVRAFDLHGREGPLSHRFDFDILAPHDLDTHGRIRPCALAATGRLVFTATTAPSLGVWHRPDENEPYGHSAYVRPPLAPLALRARVVPVPPLSAGAAAGQRGLTAAPRSLTAVERLEQALELDRLRLAGLPRTRAPFEGFRPLEGAS